METTTIGKRRGTRYTLRSDLAFAEFDDPRDDGTRWSGKLVTLSVAGLALTLDAGLRFEPGTLLRGVTLKVGECRLRGSIVVKNSRTDGHGETMIGGLFYPGSNDEVRLLMTLIAGMASVDLEASRGA